MGDHAGTEAAGGDGYGVVNDSCGEGTEKIFKVVNEGEKDDDGGERCQVRGSEGDGGEVFIDEVAHEESAPKDFFQEGDDDGQAEHPGDDGRPEEDAGIAEGVGVERGA